MRLRGINITRTPLYVVRSFPILFFSYELGIRMRNVSDKSCKENQNTLFMCPFFFVKIIPYVG